MTLGDPAVVPCVQARNKARALRAKVALGEDPQGERIAARKAITFAARVEEYLAATASRLRPRTLELRQRHLRTHCKPLHGVSPAAITRGDLMKLLAEITQRRGKVAANRCGSTLSAMFAWLMLSGVVEANPMVGVKPHPERSRDRVLNDEELTKIWHASDTGGDFDRIVRLLLLTGCRRTEIGGMTWLELTGDLFVLPASRSKNAKPHEVPLTPLAIMQLPARVKDRDLVFGTDAAGFTGWPRGKQRLDRRIGIGAIAPWSLHALRRTCSTWLAEHDTPPHIVDAVLGHTRGGVHAVYNRSTLKAQKRAALTLWATHIGGIVGLNTDNIAALA
jgi:integrase